MTWILPKFVTASEHFRMISTVRAPIDFVEPEPYPIGDGPFDVHAFTDVKQRLFLNHLRFGLKHLLISTTLFTMAATYYLAPRDVEPYERYMKKSSLMSLENAIFIQRARNKKVIYTTPAERVAFAESMAWLNRQSLDYFNFYKAVRDSGDPRLVELPDKKTDFLDWLGYSENDSSLSPAYIDSHELQDRHDSIAAVLAEHMDLYLQIVPQRNYYAQYSDDWNTNLFIGLKYFQVGYDPITLKRMKLNAQLTARTIP